MIILTAAATANEPSATYGLFLLLAIAGVYMLPTIIAFMRKHHQRGAIFVLNLFLGWSGLGWLAALIWSATSTKPRVVFVRESGAGPT